MLKYELNDKVFCLRNNKIHSAKIIARKHCDQVDDINYYASICEMEWIRRVINGLGSTYIIYDEDDKEIGNVDEDNLFSSVDDLIDSLR